MDPTSSIIQMANYFLIILLAIYTHICKNSETTEICPILKHQNNSLPTPRNMGFRLPGIRKASFSENLAYSKGLNVPKGYLAVYVGEKMKRFKIPVAYLNQPSFQDFLSQAEEEFGYHPPMGGLTIPCTEESFENLISGLNEC